MKASLKFCQNLSKNPSIKANKREGRLGRIYWSVRFLSLVCILFCYRRHFHCMFSYFTNCFLLLRWPHKAVLRQTRCRSWTPARLCITWRYPFCSHSCVWPLLLDWFTTYGIKRIKNGDTTYKVVSSTLFFVTAEHPWATIPLDRARPVAFFSELYGRAKCIRCSSRPPCSALV